MTALRSALVGIIRELPDADVARIVRAAPDEVLRALVPIALGLEEQTGGGVAMPAAEPAQAPESARGSRPTSTIGRLLEALSDGPKTTAALAEVLGITKSGVVGACKRAGARAVRPVGKMQRGVETTWEAAGK